ncbi:hypothetical protein SORBI_3001G436800 [Sorghum bicolor]|uniref:Uncharacterized protein n=2 Tax=Sorghum bicolor TaxID=4558 RepID=A0A1Z5SAN0_SORBI|nr:hypothetical protein SORBI_3001G436800 [Sorghum bicolor]
MPRHCAGRPPSQGPRGRIFLCTLQGFRIRTPGDIYKGSRRQGSSSPSKTDHLASSKRPTQHKNMLSSTVELITLWASSSSPSLLAFCFSHLIIAVILVSGRGDWTPGAAEAGTPDGILPRVRGGKRRDRGSAAASVVEHRRGCAHDDDVNGRPTGCVAEVDTDDVQAQSSEESSAAEDGASVDDTVQEKCRGDDEEEDELMMRAEEFIRRMNRVWMAENVRFC